MSASRDDILKELGLTPVWRLRTQSAAQAEPVAVPPLATVAQAPEREPVVVRALHKGRNKTVFGVGDEAAEWLFVGEGPGADEDAKGEPFVGQAGKLLDNML